MTIYEAAIQHRCSSCGAEPGANCRAKRRANAADLPAQFKHHSMHLARQGRGVRARQKATAR